MRRRTRTSLSDWYSRPEASCGETPGTAEEDSDLEADDKCGSPPESPSKRSKCQPSFFSMADDSDTQSLQSLEHSPRRMLAMSPLDARTPQGSPSGLLGSSQDPSINTATMCILRGICADYFENNVAPILRYVQQTQEQLITQLKDLNGRVDLKANSDDVTSFEEIEQVAVRTATARTDDTKVNIIVRLEELANAMKNVPTVAQLALKANAKDVPTSAQMAELAAAVALKADSNTVATSAQMAELTATVDQKADISEVATSAQMNDLVATVEQNADAATDRMAALAEAIEQKNDIDNGAFELVERVRIAEQKVAALKDELQELKKLDSAGTSVGSGGALEIPKLKALFCTTGMKVEKQMKDMQKQMKQLREDCVGTGLGERWPGRTLDTASVASLDNNSDNSDNNSDKLSLGASAAPSLVSLDPEEKAELQKIKCIVSAAGHAYSQEMRSIKKQVRELRCEVHVVKERQAVPSKVFEPRSS